MNTRDHTLKSQGKHLIMQTIQRYDHNNKIKSSASKNKGSRPYHLLIWLIT